MAQQVTRRRDQRTTTAGGTAERHAHALLKAETRHADQLQRRCPDTVPVSGRMQSMVQGMKIIQVYLDANRQGLVRCPTCGVTRRLKMDAAADLGGKTFKVRCRTCTGVFGVRVEWRRHHRLDLQLPGKLFHRGTRHLFETITVTSLSAGGIGLVLQYSRLFHAGQRYEVAFVLADPQRTIVLEDILLTRLEGTVVGAVFFPPDKYNHDLDFYLVPAVVAPWGAADVRRPPDPLVPDDSCNASSDPIDRSKRLLWRHSPSRP